MTRLAALLAVSLALAACDSGGPADDLEGTWTSTAVTNRTVAVVSRTQDAVDLAAPPEGAFTLSGDAAESLPYVWGYYRSGAYSSLYVSSFDPNAGGYPASRSFASLEQIGADQTVNARVETGTEAAEYTGRGTALFARDGARFTLGADLAPAYDAEGGAVRAEGALRLGTRRLTAGAPTVLSEYRYEFPSSSTVRYEFRRGGVLVVQEVSGNQIVSREGTWERTGERVRLTSPLQEGITVTYVYAVRREGGALLLVNDQANGPCDAWCRQSIEDTFLLEPGTLSEYRTEETIRLVPSASGRALAQVEGPTPFGLPAPLRARVRVAAE